MKLTEIILYACFLSVMILSFIILIGAFVDHKNTNKEIEAYIIEHRLLQKDTSGVLKVIPNLDSTLDKVEFKVDKLLEGNTVSFLFQLFTILLISIGVYILDKSNEKQKKIEKETDEFVNHMNRWKDLVNSNQLVLGLSNILADAVQYCRLFKSDNSKASNYIPPIREAVNNANRNILSSPIPKILIENNYKNLLIRQVTEIKSTLESIQFDESDSVISQVSRLESFFGDDNNFISVVELKNLSVANTG